MKTWNQCSDVNVKHTVPLTFFGPQIPISDWLIFCCKNLMHPERNESDKNANFIMKASKKYQKCRWKHKLVFLF